MISYLVYKVKLPKLTTGRSGSKLLSLLVCLWICEKWINIYTKNIIRKMKLISQKPWIPYCTVLPRRAAVHSNTILLWTDLNLVGHVDVVLKYLGKMYHFVTTFLLKWEHVPRKTLPSILIRWSWHGHGRLALCGRKWTNQRAFSWNRESCDRNFKSEHERSRIAAQLTMHVQCICVPVFVVGY